MVFWTLGTIRLPHYEEHCRTLLKGPLIFVVKSLELLVIGNEFQSFMIIRVTLTTYLAILSSIALWISLSVYIW
jgi:hypothetical protein